MEPVRGLAYARAATQVHATRSVSKVDLQDRDVVCHLVESLEYGGAEALVCRLASGMQAGRYRSVVCCLRKGPLAERLEAAGVRIHCLDLRRESIVAGPAFGLFVLRLFRGLKAVLAAERVAIIHAHLPDSAIWAACIGAVTRTPVISTYHGLGILPRNRRRADPRNVLRRVLIRLLSRLTDRMIAVSRPVRQLLREEVGVDERKIVLMVNGVDTNGSVPSGDRARVRAELGLEDRRVIACVGRLIAAKGQTFLVEAMAAIAHRYPDAVLLLVGDGPYRGTVEARIRELGLADHVRLAGARSDVPALLSIAEVFVLPSLSEGIPLSLVEAMAAGIPVVATAVPGNLDVVVDERFGVLAPPEDPSALAEAVHGLLADPVRARAIGTRGQARAREHFDVERLFAATAALYDQVLAERRAHHRPGGRR